MTDQAAIKGTYSDLKFIKTRKVAQVVIEVPIEQAGAFVSAFGTPQPDQETWVAIARLDEAVKEEKPKGGRLAKKAGIHCNDPQFQKFLEVDWPHIWHPNAKVISDPSKLAATVLRVLCGVESRSQLDTSASAADHWETILGRFEAWKRCMEPAA